MNMLWYGQGFAMERWKAMFGGTIVDDHTLFI